MSIKTKAYTDLEQSKTLSKILPLENADMHYKVNRGNNESEIFMIPYSELGFYKDNDYQQCVPCWSLSALLNVLPKSVRLIGTPKDSYWYCEAVNANNQWYAGWESADNPIDACYNLIIRLNKLKML